MSADSYLGRQTLSHDALMLFYENRFILLLFPRHTTSHPMPLDVTFFTSLQVYYM